jgi:hypothetical protein
MTPQLTASMIVYGLFGSLILLNLLALYALHISKKHYSLKVVTAAMFNLIKNMQKSDPIGLRAEIQKLEEQPKEIVESMIYGKRD